MARIDQYASCLRLMEVGTIQLNVGKPEGEREKRERGVGGRAGREKGEREREREPERSLRVGGSMERNILIFLCTYLGM